METFQPKSILCPTDFSEPATFALGYGKQIADSFDAKLIVLYANPFTPPPHFTAGQVDELVKGIEYSKGKARDFLVSYVKEQIGENVPFDPIVAENEAVPAILQTAEEKKADLIVMGTHGRSGFNRFMLGSVTEKVLHETDRPVLTVRARQNVREPSKDLIRQILCPINYAEVALKALEHAVAISKCFGAELLVLHVIESQSNDVKDEVEHDRLCAWISDDIRSRCSLKEIVRRGDAAERIVEVARDESSDMIVLGAQHKRFSDTTVLGTTTVRVTRHALCPVLTVIRR